MLMKRLTYLSWLTVSAVGATTLFANVAHAQEAPQPADLSLPRFHPAPVGDRFYSVQMPMSNGDIDPHAGLLFDYAYHPLVLSDAADDGSDAVVVDHQLIMHVQGAIGLADRLNVNIELPVALYQGGENPSVAGRPFREPSSQAVGDLRLGARLGLFGEPNELFQIAFGSYVWLPTGSDAISSDDAFRVRPEVIFGGCNERFVWSVVAGPEIRNTIRYANSDQTTMMSWGGGVGFWLDDARRWQLGPEFFSSVNTEDADKENTNLEALLGARYRPHEDIEIGIGAGGGILRGIGTPKFRGLLSAAYTPMQVKDEAPSDRDGDGVIDAADACPDEPGPFNDDPSKNGCPPPPDRDGDGIIDAEDACIDLKGVPNEDPAKHGCPPPGDADGDGIPDDSDACVNEPGVASDDPAKNGCPADRDDDGIPDAEDACPELAGPATDDPATNGCPDRDGDTVVDPVDACPDEPGQPHKLAEKNGCPAQVVVTDSEIKILQRVEFDVNRATIKAVSDPLLDEVAQTMKDYPEIKKIEIQGHTDNTGSEALNKNLSQRRADAVKKALVDRGIEDGRLETKGYGPEQPVADNGTEEGRQKNRRVQFVILERDKAPAAASE